MMVMLRSSANANIINEVVTMENVVIMRPSLSPFRSKKRVGGMPPFSLSRYSIWIREVTISNFLDAETGIYKMSFPAGEEYYVINLPRGKRNTTLREDVGNCATTTFPEAIAFVKRIRQLQREEADWRRIKRQLVKVQEPRRLEAMAKKYYSENANKSARKVMK